MHTAITQLLVYQDNPVGALGYGIGRASRYTRRVGTVPASYEGEAHDQFTIYFLNSRDYRHPFRTNRQTVFLLAGNLTSLTANTSLLVNE